MAQPGVVEPNGSQSIEGAAAAADAHHQNQQNGKRKHDAIDGDEKDDDSKPASGASQRELVKACFDVMSRYGEERHARPSVPSELN